MVWWQVILFPFAILYNWITRFRNHLYNIGYKPSFDFEVNVICVGNLSVGGTGKSPMVNFLTDVLGKDHHVATLSRGYGRKSQGFRLASSEDGPKDIGDEPLMFYQRSSGQMPVAVSEDRVYAIPAMLMEVPETQVIILDDGFQHRTVNPGLSILLTRFDRPFYKDHLLPAGRLREGRVGANRADIIVVTKCPGQLSASEEEPIRSAIRKYSQASVFFTHVEYGEKVAFQNPGGSTQDFIAVSGIAHNEDFIKYCQDNFSIRQSFTFPDHHSYTQRDVDQLCEHLKEDAGLLTTEKDWVKLQKFTDLQGYSCFYVPIAIRFLKDETLFIEEVQNSLKEYSTETFEHSEDH